MTKIKRKWDLLSKDRRESCVEALVKFFEKERGEKIGIFVAEDILDVLLQNTAEHIYDKGVADAKSLISSRFLDMEVDLDLLVGK